MSRASNKVLCDRGAMLSRVRTFFKERDVLEVDCSILESAGHIDLHIDLLKAVGKTSNRFLHPSPEYAMKRLLAQGIGDIYQLSHVFRDGEAGPLHSPEFTMLEWYRTEMTYRDLIDETLSLIEELLGPLQKEELSYKQAFLHFVNLNPFTATEEELLHCLKTHNIPLYPELIDEGKDALLNLILGALIEPKLGNGTLTVLNHYPASQAALSQIIERENHLVAERFEVYYQGVELANGYHELLDPIEQRERLVEANNKRAESGKDPYPIDEPFILALQEKIPDCSGVSVGFDRLMMLRSGLSHIQQVLPLGIPG